MANPVISEPEGEPVSNADIKRLIKSFPLAWVIAIGSTEASQLPLVGVFDGEDCLVEIIGHLGLRNPLRAALQDTGRALILFAGPQGYISPSMVGRRNWGPTWNFAQVKVDAKIEVREEFTSHALDVLAAEVEAGMPDPWSPDELGERYGSLAAHIIGFRAAPTRVIPRFKLAQDESPEDLRNILAHMPEGELKEWMRAANRARLS